MASAGDLQRAPRGAVRLNREAIERISAALETAGALESQASGEVTVEDRIDSSSWQLELPVAALTETEVLGELRRLPVRLKVTVSGGEWEVRIEAPPERHPEIHCEGRLYDVVDPEEYEEFQGIAAAGRAGELLERWLAERTATVALRVENDVEATGIRWVRTETALRAALARSWLSTLRAIFGLDRPETLLVGDAGGAVLRAPSLHVCGPDALPATSPDAWLTDLARRWWDDHRRTIGYLPAPRGIVPAPSGDGELEDLRRALVGTARALAWLWLAEVVEPVEVPRVSFVGERVAQVALDVAPADAADDEIALWDWAMEERDPARHQVIQRAVALAVFGESDLARAARPALRTAATLLKTMRKDELAEAMATRRSVREAAIGASRAAADAARAAGTKSLERVAVQLAAAAGILIAHGGDALSASASRGLLALVLALLLASGAIAMLSDYPSASGILASFREDLRIYLDTLSDEDLEQIKAMSSIEDAATRIRNSQAISAVLMLIAVVALVAAIVLVGSAPAAGAAESLLV